MRRLMMVVLFAVVASQASAQTMTCSPVVSNCQYNGCFIAYSGLAGVYGISEVACALCNDAAEAAFFGYVKPYAAGQCTSTTAASSCLGCNWCIYVLQGSGACPVREPRCKVIQEGDCDTSPIVVAVGGPSS